MSRTLSPKYSFKEARAIALAHAPYLAESLTLFPDIIETLETVSPDRFLLDLFEALPKTVHELGVEMSVLRVLKRKVHLVIALADISKVWSWVEVTESLTQLADLCMNRILRAVAIDAGLKPPQNPIKDSAVPGLFILAVGKYGARELNYSSDIDFNVFYDPEKLQLPDMNKAERVLIRMVQKLIRAFEQDNGDGYIFRTDLRLRPDPRSNAIVVSTQTAERYYESLGQNWERAAMIKARVCGGDRDAGQDFIQNVLSPFIWRRNLDYAAIEDIHAIKRQMQAVKGLESLNVAGHNLKLGLGGIREIEFFVQVQQLILGGRYSQLRGLRTVDTLKALAEGGFVNPKTTEILNQIYSDLRSYEHCAQMREDVQTHLAPKDDNARTSLAKLAGFDTLKAFDAHLKTGLLTVHEIYSALFPEAETLSSERGNLVFTGVEADPDTLKTLSELGFSEPEKIWTHMADWLGGRIAATRSERSRELLTALAPKILQLCSKTGESEAAFSAFASFFTEINSGRTLLTMFARHPERLEHIIALMLASPRIRDTIANQPRILDVMSDPDFLNFSDTVFQISPADEMDTALDFEGHLDAVRQSVREEHFRICAATLSDQLESAIVPVQLTQIADRAIQRLLPVSATEVARVFGAIKGDFAVLGLGKLGGRELSLSSDLDIMVIYQTDDDPRNVLTFTRLTQRLVSALSVQTAEGGLFDVDMALRPSGRAGPVAVSLPSFENYYKSQAWTWEYMALTRARIIASSSPKFEKQLALSVKRALTAPRPDLDFTQDILDMRRRTAQEKPPRTKWDIKESQGGLRDIEYIAQATFLNMRSQLERIKAGSPQSAFSTVTSTQAMLSLGRKNSLITVGDFTALSAALEFYQKVQTLGAMISTRSVSDFDAVEVARLAQNLSVSDAKLLQTQRDRHYEKVASCVQAILGDVY